MPSLLYGLAEHVFGTGHQLPNLLSILRQLAVPHLPPRRAVGILQFVAVEKLAVHRMARLHGRLFDQLLIIAYLPLKLLSFAKPLFRLDVYYVLYIPLIPGEHVVNSIRLRLPILRLLDSSVVLRAEQGRWEQARYLCRRSMLFLSFLLMIPLKMLEQLDLCCVLCRSFRFIHCLGCVPKRSGHANQELLLEVPRVVLIVIPQIRIESAVQAGRVLARMEVVFRRVQRQVSVRVERLKFLMVPSQVRATHVYYVLRLRTALTLKNGTVEDRVALIKRHCIRLHF